MHVIPRRMGDWANNDDIYEELGGKSKVRVDNEEREPRSAEEMKKKPNGYVHSFQITLMICLKAVLS